MVVAILNELHIYIRTVAINNKKPPISFSLCLCLFIKDL